MSSNSNEETAYETVIVEVQVTRVSESAEPGAFRYDFSTGAGDLPPSVTERFSEFLQQRLGFDPELEEGLQVVPDLDELPEQAREHARRHGRTGSGGE